MDIFPKFTISKSIPSAETKQTSNQVFFTIRKTATPLTVRTLKPLRKSKSVKLISGQKYFTFVKVTRSLQFLGLSALVMRANHQSWRNISDMSNLLRFQHNATRFMNLVYKGCYLVPPLAFILVKIPCR